MRVEGVGQREGGRHPCDEARTHAAKVGHPRRSVVEEHQPLRARRRRPTFHAAALPAATVRPGAGLQPLPKGQAGVCAEDGVDPRLAKPLEQLRSWRHVLRAAPELRSQLEVERLEQLDAQRPPRQRVNVAVHDAHLHAQESR